MSTLFISYSTKDRPAAEVFYDKAMAKTIFSVLIDDSPEVLYKEPERQGIRFSDPEFWQRWLRRGLVETNLARNVPLLSGYRL